MKMVILALSASLFSLAAHAHGGGSTGIHLKFQNGAIHAHCDWLSGPQEGQESVLQIQWMNGQKHVPMELPGTFKVTLLMPSMPEMKNPPTVIARVMGEDGNPALGAYRVNGVYFSMGGAWDVQVEVTFADGKTETQTIKVEL